MPRFFNQSTLQVIEKLSYLGHQTPLGPSKQLPTFIYYEITKLPDGGLQSTGTSSGAGVTLCLRQFNLVFSK